MKKMLFNKGSIPFILEALEMETDIPHEKIGGFYKGKIYENDLFSIMELGDEIIKDKKEMEKNEIKKMLYRENPTANLLHILKGIAYYNAKHNDISIDFEIPVDELKGADFYLEMETKFLIRWLV